MSKKKRPPKYVYTYSLLAEMTASPIEPLAAHRRDFQIKSMRDSLARIESQNGGTKQDWCACSDAVNIFETLMLHGPYQIKDGSVVDIVDHNGLLNDAVAALSEAIDGYEASGSIKMNDVGLAAMKAVLEDYETTLIELPARALIRAHRLTEKRIQDVKARRGVDVPGKNNKEAA